MIVLKQNIPLDKNQSINWVQLIVKSKDTVQEKNQSIYIKDSIRDCIAKMDRLLEKQLNAILHHPEFQQLESTWRSLHFLVFSFKKSRRLMIRGLNIHRNELLRDFEMAVDFDKSKLFKLVYEEEFGTFGGTPFGLLIGDMAFSHSPQDLFLLEALSKVASASHAVFLSGVAPKLLDIDHFTELSIPREWKRIFERKELVRWHSLRKREDFRYVALTLPRFVLRAAYGLTTGREKPGPLNFEEQTVDARSQYYLWGNAAFLLAQRICIAFLQDGWRADFHGMLSGRVEQTPQLRYDTLNHTKNTAEVIITDEMERQLSREGLLSICRNRRDNVPVVLSTQTVYQPRFFKGKPAISENDRIAARLPHVLNACRFAHYFKAILRDKIGKFINRAEIEKYLNDWLRQFVISDSTADTRIKHLKPLKESRVEVIETPRKPGKYILIANIRPHYQLEGLGAAVRLVSEVPSTQSRV